MREHYDCVVNAPMYHSRVGLHAHKPPNAGLVKNVLFNLVRRKAFVAYFYASDCVWLWICTNGNFEKHSGVRVRVTGCLYIYTLESEGHRVFKYTLERGVIYIHLRVRVTGCLYIHLREGLYTSQGG